MKRIIYLIILLCFTLCMVGCNTSIKYNDEYKINITDNYNVIINKDELLSTPYKKGDKVTVKLRFFSGPRVGLLVDGEEIPHVISDITGNTYEFVMPEHDVTLTGTWNDLTVKYDSIETMSDKELNIIFVY